MKAALDRKSSSGNLVAVGCPHAMMLRSGITPLKRLQPARAYVARPPLHAGLHASQGLHVLAAAQERMWSLAEELVGSPGRAMQAAFEATTSWFQNLLRQVWLAAMAVNAAARIAEQQQQQAAAAAAAAAEDAAALAAMQLPNPLEFVAAATSGAVERLRHTLCDASCTLDTKWSALEATVGSTMSSLFLATSKSAEALNSLGEQGAAGPSARAWQEQATKEVLQHEEAMYQQVFVQVYGELLGKDNRQISYSST